jgi:hypothetical protein
MLQKEMMTNTKKQLSNFSIQFVLNGIPIRVIQPKKIQSDLTEYSSWKISRMKLVKQCRISSASYRRIREWIIPEKIRWCSL